MPSDVYLFEDFELDASTFELRRAGRSVGIEPRVFDLILFLVRNRRRVVGRPELLEQVWGTQFVSEAALTTALRSARSALADSGSTQRLIRTAHGRGYRFVGQVSHTASAREVDAAPDDVGEARQVVRFCAAADGTTIAYASLGAGPPLVKVASWTGHIDLEWQTPVWVRWLRGLGRGRRLVRYDGRGSGLSERAPAVTGFESWLTDLEAVVDDAGLERFPLLGIAQGGAVAVEYAARHPERVSGLVLSGAYARGRSARAVTDLEKAEVGLEIDLARVGWHHRDGSFMQAFAAQVVPDSSPEQWSELIDYQRRTTDAAAAVEILRESFRIDVTEVAPRVRCPVLVVHARGDRRVPASQAGELAALVPDSELVLLDSNSHLLTDEDPAWPDYLDHVHQFLDRLDR